jgi:hypothetical protein
MAKKSRGFRELLNQSQRKVSSQQKSLDNFERRFQQSEMGGKFADIVKKPKGEVKMSETLKTFIQPYLAKAKGYQRQKMLLHIAVTAWNLTFMPEAERQLEIEKLLDLVVQSTDPLVREDTKGLIEELMARKEEVFPENRNYILDFQFEDAGEQFHLSVASAPVPVQQ